LICHQQQQRILPRLFQSLEKCILGTYIHAAGWLQQRCPSITQLCRFAKKGNQITDLIHPQLLTLATGLWEAEVRVATRSKQMTRATVTTG
jgi:hypothetical protein